MDTSECFRFTTRRDKGNKLVYYKRKNLMSRKKKSVEKM